MSDQSARLIALLVICSALCQQLWGYFYQQQSSAHFTERMMSILSRGILLIALAGWVHLSGLPFGKAASDEFEWVNRLAEQLSTLTWQLPLKALATSCAHCFLCIVLWEDWRNAEQGTKRKSSIVLLGLVGLIALGTDALLGYASGSPLFVLE